MKKLSLTLLLIGQLAFLSNTLSQNIAINELGSLPDTSAMLDVSSMTKGFLTPRLTTTQQNNISLPANGLLIYNTTENTFKVNKGTPAAPNWTTLGYGSGSTTNTAATSANTLTTTVNGVSATAPMINTSILTLTGTKLTSTINGFTSPPTDLISMQNVAWNLNGNTGTTPATHFLGTTDNNDFIFKTNSIEAMRLTGDRRLLGLNVSNPIYRIQVEDPGGPDADIAARMYNASNQNFFPSLQLQVSAGTRAAPLPVTNGTILGVLHFVGFDGAGYSDVISTGIEVKTSQNWNTSSHGAYMYFKTTANNSTAESERMRIDQNGNVGINTMVPGSTLDVKGDLRLSGSASGYVGLTTPASAGSTTYTLPAADGLIGQTLTTNGSGLLSWSSHPSTAGLVPYTGASAAVNLGSNNFTTTGTISGATLSTSGNTTLGTNSANTIQINGAFQGANPLVFDGVTAGGNMTTLAVADPTATNVLTLPNTTGTMMTKVQEDAAPKLGGTLTLNEKSIDITSALSAKQGFVGMFETAVAGEPVVFGDALYFDFATQKWRKANADAASTTPVQRMAVENIAANASGKMLVEGFIKNAEWSFTAATVYLSSGAAGTITTTQPGTAGDQVQRVGIAMSTNKLQFRPSIDVKGL